jgi:hypothetical protein
MKKIACAFLTFVLAQSVYARDGMNIVDRVLSDPIPGQENMCLVSANAPLVYSPTSVRLCRQEQIQRQEEDLPTPLLKTEKKSGTVKGERE